MPPERPRRPQDPFAAAEAVFAKKKAPVPMAEERAPSLPGARELVSIRLDRDVLEHFQSEGPGWQERINDALRAIVASAAKG